MALLPFIQDQWLNLILKVQLNISAKSRIAKKYIKISDPFLFVSLGQLDDSHGNLFLISYLGQCEIGYANLYSHIH